MSSLNWDLDTVGGVHIIVVNNSWKSMDVLEKLAPYPFGQSGQDLVR